MWWLMPGMLALERLRQYDHITCLQKLGLILDVLTKNWLSSPNRKDKKNHTNKLRELALLIPVTMTTRNKKHTKVWGLKEMRQEGGRMSEQYVRASPGKSMQALSVTDLKQGWSISEQEFPGVHNSTRIFFLIQFLAQGQQVLYH